MVDCYESHVHSEVVKIAAPQLDQLHTLLRRRQIACGPLSSRTPILGGMPVAPVVWPSQTRLPPYQPAQFSFRGAPLMMRFTTSTCAGRLASRSALREESRIFVYRNRALLRTVIS